MCTLLGNMPHFVLGTISIMSDGSDDVYGGIVCYRLWYVLPISAVVSPFSWKLLYVQLPFPGHVALYKRYKDTKIQRYKDTKHVSDRFGS